MFRARKLRVNRCGLFTECGYRPELKLGDAGKTWTLADLKGKTTFINIWGTWGGPCRDELPLLQKLYEAVRDRGDVQVITLNIDENPGEVEPYNWRLHLLACWPTTLKNSHGGDRGQPDL